jgi:uncharacterized protein (DUF433 family)
VPTASSYTELIQATPRVCGGSPCIAGTRIPVWIIEGLRRDGASVATLIEMYPTLSENQILAAFRYADQHADEIAAEIRSNEDA